VPEIIASHRHPDRIERLLLLSSQICADRLGRGLLFVKNQKPNNPAKSEAPVDKRKFVPNGLHENGSICDARHYCIVNVLNKATVMSKSLLTEFSEELTA
jgi:hypothetical protein